MKHIKLFEQFINENSYYELIKQNWDEISYSYGTGGKKVPMTITNDDAESTLYDLDDSFSDMDPNSQKKAIKDFKKAFKDFRKGLK